MNLREELADAIQFLAARGLAPGTGGNFSAVLSQAPLRLLLTPSGCDKGSVKPAELLEVNEQGEVLAGSGRPSAETLLHTTIAACWKPGSILHTHSVPNTVLSMIFGDEGGLDISGFEMLKGLDGVTTHEHCERVPILENSQDMPALAEKVRGLHVSHPKLHGFLLRGHGLYTWGQDVAGARRHVEIFEFLFEAKLRLIELKGR